MVTDDQALALRSEVVRQEAEIEIFRYAGESNVASVVGNLCRHIHRAPREERTDVAHRTSIRFATYIFDG
jgi:hypothetical protein